MFQPKPTPSVTRPPDRWSSEAMVLASAIGSCWLGSATAVPSLMAEVTAAAMLSETHGSRGARERPAGGWRGGGGGGRAGWGGKGTRGWGRFAPGVWGGGGWRGGGGSTGRRARSGPEDQPAVDVDDLRGDVACLV